MTWEASQLWWARSPIVRWVVEAMVRGRARRHLAELDHLPLAQCQVRTLTRLVRQAQATRFGRDHDFRRIRNVADFRRLVPVCTPLDLWHAYWSTAYPHLKGVTWPGEVSFLAHTGNGTRPYPATAESWRTHRAAVATALAHVMHARPRSRPLRGQLLYVGNLGVGPSLPVVLRPYVLGVEAPRRPLGDEALSDLVQRTESRTLTCVGGDAAWLIRFFEALKRITGRDDLREVWPDLTAVLFTQRANGTDREQLAQVLATQRGEVPILLVEAAARPEAPVAVEDPRHGLLRLLPNHGVYFEFVPVSEIHQPRPTRHGAEEVEPGVPYAVAVTSPAGMWACLIGMTVCFESRDPPLFRLVSTAATRGLGDRVDPALFPFPLQAPHPRNGTVPETILQGEPSSFPRQG